MLHFLNTEWHSCMQYRTSAPILPRTAAAVIAPFAVVLTTPLTIGLADISKGVSAGSDGQAVDPTAVVMRVEPNTRLDPPARSVAAFLYGHEPFVALF